jgi:methyl-accepting chemotaxis protein
MTAQLSFEESKTNNNVTEGLVMTWYKNLTIKGKLLLNFGSVLLLTIALGYIAYTGVNQMNENTRVLYNNNTLGLAYISRIAASFQDIRVAVRTSMIRGFESQLENKNTSHDIQAQAEVIEKSQNLVAEYLKKYEATFNDQADREAHKRLSDEIEQYKKAYIPFRTFLEARDFATARTYMENELVPLANKVKAQIEAMVVVNEESATKTNAVSLDTTDSVKRTILILILLSVVIGAFTSLRISKYISGAVAQFVDRFSSLESICIRNLAHGSKQLAAGDLNIKIVTGTKLLELDTQDEFGMLAKHLNEIIKSTQETVGFVDQAVHNIRITINESQKLVDAAKDGALSVRSENANVHGSYLELVNGLNATLDAVASPLKEAGAVLAELAKGDLRQQMQGQYNGAFHLMKENINTLAKSLDTALVRVSESVAATASAASQISSSSEELAAGAQEQSSQTSEVAGAIDQMTKTIIGTNANVARATETATISGNIAREGGDVVSNTIEGMNKIAEVVTQAAATVKELGSSSDKIGEIVQVIDDIADQTNLLALNAAIEAARAGEQGRGFAVVADEVRKLAERTTKATKEIAAMIKQIQKDTGNAVAAMERGTAEVTSGKLLAQRAEQSLHGIINSSREVVDNISTVAAASEEQASAAEEISKNIESIATVINQSAEGTQQIAQAAEDLNRLTDNLQQLIGQFKISVNETSYLTQNSYRHSTHLVKM